MGPESGRGGELTRKAFIGYYLLDAGDRRRDVPRSQKYHAADDGHDNCDKNKGGKILQGFPQNSKRPSSYNRIIADFSFTTFIITRDDNVETIDGQIH
jgi:hypothetical protein